jgi:Zn-dependent protease/predicted transcriptional regulator
MSFQISKIKGIPIKLHFTLIIVFFLITWTLASGFMPQFFPNLSAIHYWIMGIAGAIILFISVLLHELAHSILSLRYGLKVRQIILFIFGGVSDIKEELKKEEDYGKEFKIAVVGPLTSFALAGVFTLSWLILLQASNTSELAVPVVPEAQEGRLGDIEERAMMTEQEISRQEREIEIEEGFGFISIIRIISGVLLYAAIVNALLGAFNLLPAFPLDGGRMLRAGLIKWKKSYNDATKIAVKVGTAISYGLMAFGFITIFTGSFIGGFWLILIGWFLQSGAQAYLQQHELSAALSGVRLRDIMNTRFVSVRPNITIKELLNNYFNVYRKSEFPVTDEMGYLLGAVSAKQAINIPESNIDKVKVEEIMTPAKELIVMSPDRHADEALKRMYQENKSRIFVCTASSHIGGGGLADQSTVEQKRRWNNSSSKNRTNKQHQALLQKGQQLLKLIGIISKTDILNIATERQEYEKEVKKKLATDTTNPHV